MVVTGIISAINKSSGSFRNNKYSVQIEYFKTPGDTDVSHYTLDANCSTIGGMQSDYAVGDKVYVDFMYDKFALPIIIGRIYQGTGTAEEARGYLHLDSLKVDGNIELSSNIKLGTLEYSDFEILIKSLKALPDDEFVLGNEKTLKTSGVKLLKASDTWVSDEKHIATTAAIQAHGGGGSGGTAYHNELINLDYEHSGHTGFASSRDLEAVEEILDDVQDDVSDIRSKLTKTIQGSEIDLLSLIAESTDYQIKAFSNGIWIGNIYPDQSATVFTPIEDCLGIFRDNTDHKLYNVVGTYKEAFYTGDVVARFG